MRPFGSFGEFVTGGDGLPLPGPQRPVIPPPPWSENYEPSLDPDHEPPIEAKREEESAP
jgi:hypothetical protein